MSACGRLPRLDDDRAVHAVRDVHQHRLRAAVVHEDAGVVGAERVADRLAREDVGEVLVRSDARGMEVDRMRDRSLVRQRHMDELPLADVDDRPRRATGPRPGGVPDAGSDRDRHVLEDEVDVCDRAGRSRRQCGGKRRVRLRQVGRVRRRSSGVAREGAHRGGGARGHPGHPGHRARCCAIGSASRVARVDPHRHGHDSQYSDEHSEEHSCDANERE